MDLSKLEVLIYPKHCMPRNNVSAPSNIFSINKQHSQGTDWTVTIKKVTCWPSYHSDLHASHACNFHNTWGFTKLQSTANFIDVK